MNSPIHCRKLWLQLKEENRHKRPLSSDSATNYFLLRMNPDSFVFSSLATLRICTLYGYCIQGGECQNLKHGGWRDPDSIPAPKWQLTQMAGLGYPTPAFDLCGTSQGCGGTQTNMQAQHNSLTRKKKNK